ncbi:MAG: enoyl-CoA hydratase/isomerase family protein [Acetobacteraceae bacterium]|nr:enoyl-CoA hydratase/isomerase family protein [Acetobacteraceae bacterium]
MPPAASVPEGGVRLALVIVEQPKEGVALVRLNRPEARNALSVPLRRELAAAFTVLAADEAIRAAVLTGDARAFAAGADLAEMADLDVRGAMARPTQALSAPIEKFPKPLIAAIEGACLGGGLELALMADILVAGEGARLGLPEIKVGVLPGNGGTQRLPRLVGRPAAMLMLLTGEPVGARRALEMGLISELAPEGGALDRALEIAGRVGAMPPIAAMLIKELVNEGAEASLPAAQTMERRAMALLFATDDRQEGVRAFLEKRRPVFRGR